MRDINRVLITGNVATDIVLAATKSTQKVLNMRIGVHSKIKISSTETKEETNFLTVIVWGNTAESCIKYLKKGSKVFIEGRLQNREYFDKTNQKRSAVEIVADMVEFLDRPEKLDKIDEIKEG